VIDRRLDTQPSTQLAQCFSKVLLAAYIPEEALLAAAFTRNRGERETKLLEWPWRGSVL
jgi:hypothetical protein